MHANLNSPTVSHSLNEDCRDPNAVYVGAGSCMTTLSPWSCPSTPEDYDLVRLRMYLALRADCKDWIARLNGKVLVCNCDRPPEECWAQMLRTEFENRFGDHLDTTEAWRCDVEEADLEDTDDEELVMKYVAGKDDIKGPEANENGIPRPVPWPDSWIRLVQTIRGLSRPTMWEQFAGMGRLTAAFQNEGAHCAPPIDAATDPEYNVLNAAFMMVVVGLLSSHLIDLLHLAPPCSTFPIARSLNLLTRLRSKEFPDGLPNLQPKQMEQVRIGNALAEAAAVMMKVQHKAGNLVQLEQPAGSLMEFSSAIKAALDETGAKGYQRDSCRDGAPWRKPLICFTPTGSVGVSIVAHCKGCVDHIRLWGKAKNGVDLTKMSTPYWPAWARAIAKRWMKVLNAHCRKEGWQNAAPLMITGNGSTIGETIEGSNFSLAKGRTVEKYADTLSSGVQPTRKALPQLIPDGLPEHLHLEAALMVNHPMTYVPSTTAPVRYALKHTTDDLNDTAARRMQVLSLMKELAEACEEENAELTMLCEATVRKVLGAFGTKNVVLMRELAFVCGTRDITSPCALLVGLPMLGWAPGADGLMERVRCPQMPMHEFMKGRDERNRRIIAKTGPSGDAALDAEAFKKTLTEVERGVLAGPYASTDDLPFSDFAVVPRHGIWEQHGSATQPTCRDIDDMLVGEQNATVGTTSSHRPTDPDSLVAQVRAVRRRHNSHQLHGWPCDLKSAYKQVPNDPRLVRLSTIVQWSPEAQRAVFFLAFCQLFGGKSPPLNFARYPAWLCEVAAVLFGIPVSHCVDDMISVEPRKLAMLGRWCFVELCRLTGWEISEEKSPLPSDCFVVIGVELDLAEVPTGEAAIRVTAKRIEQLEAILLKIQKADRLGSGESASVTGKLGFTLCACFGRHGRAKLRPFIRRAYESRTTMNTQLRSAIIFWLQFLQTFVARQIPVFLDAMDVAVSYSDGEGDKAGLGVAVWSARCPGAPLAAFCEIPESIRRLWDSQREAEAQSSDIFLIEAIGPLVLLQTYPNILKNSLWLHFIDNEAAQHSLVKGSSSIACGDVVVGETWRKIQRLGIYPYFDRVESKANPVDGLSRGRAVGPWNHIDKAVIPADLERKLSEALKA